MNNISVLRLFKGYEGAKSKNLSEEGLKYGLAIPMEAPAEVIKEAIKMYGKDGKKWNQTFHKDLSAVVELPIEILIAQQLVHYFTTYGLEELGMYSEDTIYVPHEKLEVPELDENIELVVIHPYTKEEIAEKLMTLVTSGIALSEDTLDDVKELSDLIDKNRFDEVVNRELRSFLYDKYGVMPKDPEAFLRYLIYKVTGVTLKITNVAMIETIKQHAQYHSSMIKQMLTAYVSQPRGWEKLAGIFLRNKRLFLAFKSQGSFDECKEINKIINRLRKKAIVYHKPMPVDILGRLTDVNTLVEEDKLIELLDKVTIYRELRIIQGLRYRLYGNKNIVYKVRNGKSFTSTVNKYSAIEQEVIAKRRDIVYNHLIKRLKEKVEGKTVYLPSEIVYKVPTSEKQYVGMFPAGSYIDIPRNEEIVFGVHWVDLPYERVDLDLHLTGERNSYGWNTGYRDGRELIFTGDMTAAPKPQGATELYYVSHEFGEEDFVVNLNTFTGNREPVPFEFVVAKADRKKVLDKAQSGRRNDGSYVIDPNDILVQISMHTEPNENRKVLGMLKVSKDNIRILFDNYTTGTSIISARNELAQSRLAYETAMNELRLNLRDVLKDAGAELVDWTSNVVKEVVVGENLEDVEVETTIYPDIDLSLDKLTKDSIMKIFS